MKNFIKKRKIILLIIPLIVLIALIGIFLLAFPDKTTKSSIPAPAEDLQLTKPIAKQIQVALEEAVKNPNSDNLGQLGLIYHSNTFYNEAKECYLLAIQANPDDWKWSYYLGYLLSELGEVENAIKYFSRVIELNPGDVYATYYLGEAYVKQGNSDQAEKLFSVLEASDQTYFKPGEEISHNLYPLRVYAKLSLARLLSTTSRMLKAEETLHSLLVEYPDYGPAYRLLANLYAQQGKEKASTEHSIRANELCQFTPPVDPRIAQLALLSRSDEYILKQIDIAAFTSNQEWAKKLLDHGLNFMPDHPYLNSKSIQFYLLYGFGDDINQKIDKHYTAFINDFNELAKIASQFNKNGKYGWAIMYYERCAALKPGDKTILHNLAINYSNVGDKEKSGALIERLLQANQDSIKLLADAAKIFTRLGENKQAEQLIDKIEALSPEEPIISKLRAGVALYTKDDKVAVEYYSKYLKKVPDDQEVIQYLGDRFLEARAWNAAIDHYKKALGYFPNHAVFLEKLGTLYYNCPDIKFRNLQQAKYYLERVYYSIKSSMETRILAGKSLAGIYASERKWESAVSVINTARILATRGKFPDQEIRLLTKTMEDYQINSLNTK